MEKINYNSSWVTLLEDCIPIAEFGFPVFKVVVTFCVVTPCDLTDVSKVTEKYNATIFTANNSTLWSCG